MSKGTRDEAKNAIARATWWQQARLSRLQQFSLFLAVELVVVLAGLFVYQEARGEDGGEATYTHRRDLLHALLSHLRVLRHATQQHLLARRRELLCSGARRWPVESAAVLLERANNSLYTPIYCSTRPSTTRRS